MRATEAGSRARGARARGPLRRLALLLTLAAPGVGCGEAGPPGEILVPRDAVWRYTIDPARAEGEAWRDPGFDDAGWEAGPGPLGFHADGLGTVTPRPMDADPAHLSTWHRHAFEVEDPEAFAGLVVRYVRDDGLDLVLNGTSIVESNLPVLDSGSAGPEVAAPSSVSGDQELAIYALPVDPALLRRGRNVLAAQVRQERPESSDQRLEVELVGVRPRDRAVLLRGPYLQQVTPESVVVRFTTSRPARAAVRFGPPGSARSREAASPAPVLHHELELDGLEPGSEVVYALRVEGEAPAGAGPLRTRVPPRGDTAERLRFVVIGDAGTGNEIAFAVQEAIARELAEHPAHAVLVLGDYAYPTGSEAEMQEGLFDVFGGIMARVPFWPVLGNHEEKRSFPVAQEGPYFEHFTLPTRGEAGGVASGNEAYYAFDVGPVHVQALDSTAHGTRADGPMMQWVRADLAGAEAARWRFAFLHHAPHSAGTHGHGDGHQRTMRSRLMPLLERGGTDLVLGGHSHGYERSFLLHGFHEGPEALRDRMILDRGDEGVYAKPGGVAPGTVYVVAGIGGAPGSGDFDHPAMVSSAGGVAGAVVIDVQGCRLELRAFDVEGQDIDRFVLEKGPPCEAPAS